MKKWIAFILAAAVCAGLSGCDGEAANERILQAVFGEPFTLPESCEVTAPDGTTVALYGETFTADACGEYVARAESGRIYKINVIKGDKPLIKLSYEKAYAEAGKEFLLPDVAVTSGAVNVSYTESLVIDGKTYQVPQSRSVVVRAGSEYVYSVAAANACGKSEKECRIVAVPAGDYRTEIIAELGEPYGVNQCGDFFGYNASYTTEKQYGNDSGSLKLEMNHDKLTDQQFRLKNVFISDLTEYSEIYFYAYNDSDMTVTWSLNYGLFATLLPRQWTRCSFSGFEGLAKDSTNPIFREYFDITDINGLTMASFLERWTSMAQAVFYISSVYAAKPVTEDDARSALIAVPDVIDEESKSIFLNAVSLYKKLTEEERLSLKNEYRMLNTLGEFAGR
ncbi:MAG: hypothetical protein ACI4SH_06670 [Candidatus Scatosoma sp.]